MTHILTEEYQTFLKDWMNGAEVVVAHTSGSTGEPKEIALKKQDMIASAQATNKRFGISADSVLFSSLSSHYIAGKMMLIRALTAGCQLITEPPSLIPLRTCPDGCDRIDLMCVVPSQVESLLTNPIAHDKLKNLIIGGAPLNPIVEEALEEMPWNSYITYGMTETCSHVALRKAGEKTYSAMPGITFALDSRGCLIINAPHLSFNVVTTNDSAELISDTEFLWLGRADNAINSGGIKFHPEQLEQLLSSSLNMPFYIHSVTDNKWGDAVAITVEDLSGKLTTESVLNICRELLPKYAVPRVVNIIPQLKRTSSGKIQRT